MKKLLYYLFLSCFSLSLFAQADRAEIKKQINKIKKSQAYISAEATMPTEAEAMDVANQLLVMEINNWIQSKRHSDEVQQVVLQDINSCKEMLDMKRGVFVPEEDDEEADEWNNDIFQVAETPFSELEEDTRTAMEELLEDNINEYMIHKDYIPEGKDLQDMADWVLKETNEAFYLKVVSDDSYRRLVDDTVRKLVKEWRDDGMEIKTYTESLTVMETERLIIRKITRKDMGVLLTLMGKPEVMYAWEHGFEKKEVRQWLNRQLARYRKDGYGYFALVLKAGGEFIGQAGLIKSVINGNESVKIGYILDDAYWHYGYATEAARRCLRYAFEELGLTELYCSIRPENASSIRVAEAIGMTPCGSQTIVYNGKEMPHLLYKAEKPRNLLKKEQEKKNP